MLGWDAGLGVLAAAQYYDGRSPSPLYVTTVDGGDLAADVATRVTWWAPGYQMLPLAGRMAGLSWGASLKVVCCATLLVGAAGWAAYLVAMLGPGTVAAAVWVAILSSKYVFVAAFTYQGGDSLLWAAAPWAVLLTRATVAPRRCPHPVASVAVAGVAGLLVGGLFLLKFSAAGLILGLGGGLALEVGRQWLTLAGGHRLRFALVPAAAWGIGVAAALGAARAGGFGVGPTPASVVVATPGLARGIRALGTPLMGAFDLQALASGLSDRLRWSERPVDWAAAVLAVCLAAWAAVSVASRGRRQAISQGPQGPADGAIALLVLATCGGLADVLMLAVLAGRGTDVSADGRLARVSGLMLVPVILRAVRPGERRPGRGGMAGVTVAVLVAVAMPAAYGLVMGAYNVWVAPRQVDPDGVVDMRLPPGVDVRQLFAAVRRAVPAPGIIYCTYPQYAFAFRDRRVTVVHAEDLMTSEQLAAVRHPGRPAGGVGLFVPAAFATNGKLTAIESSFVELHRWVRSDPLPDPHWAVWVGTP